MLWFLFFVFCSVTVYVVIWFLFCTFVLKDDWIILMVDKKKAFFVPLLYVVYCTIVTIRAPLYENVMCWRDGTIQKMEIQYSWVMGQCQGKTNQGVFIEMRRQRGLPGSDEHHDTAQDDTNGGMH